MFMETVSEAFVLMVRGRADSDITAPSLEWYVFPVENMRYACGSVIPFPGPYGAETWIVSRHHGWEAEDGCIVDFEKHYEQDLARMKAEFHTIALSFFRQKNYLTY
jgi:hypothetical protein